MSDTAGDLPLVDERDDGGRRKRSRWFAAIGLVALIALIAAVVVLRKDPDPADELAKVRAFIADATSTHVEADLETKFTSGRDGLGQAATSTFRLAGDMRFPDAAHMVLDAGEMLSESIVVDGKVYSRDAEDDAELEGAQWSADELDGDAMSDLGALAEEGMMGFAGVMSGMTTGFGEPDSIRLIVSRLHDATTDGDGIEAKLSMAELVAAGGYDGEMPDEFPDGEVTVRVESGSSGRLDRLVVRVRMEPADEMDEDDGPFFGTFTSTTDMRFSRWGEPVTIDAPAPETIDRTPGIDEAAFASAPVDTLLAPATLPANFLLVDAYTDAGDEEAEMCPEAYLRYADPADEEASAAEDFEGAYPASIDITFTPASCAFDVEGLHDFTDDDRLLSKDQPLQVGPYAATISRYGGTDELLPSVVVRFTVGGTKVTLETDVPEAAFQAVIGSLVPFDIATAPVHRVEV